MPGPEPAKKRGNLLSYFSKPSNGSGSSSTTETAGSSSSKPLAPTSQSETTGGNGNGSEDDLALERTTMAPDWFSAFEKEMQKPYFRDIKSYLAKEKKAGQKIFPPDSQRYSFTQYPLSEIKVVILGQDPYHGPSQAHGLAFSVQKGVQVPPSLANMFQELAKEYEGEGKVWRKPGHGCLEGWAGQGEFSDAFHFWLLSN